MCMGLCLVIIPRNNTYNSCLHSNYIILGISHNLEMRLSTQKDICRLYVNTLFNISTGALENVDINGRHGDVLKSAPPPTYSNICFQEHVVAVMLHKMWLR